MVTKIEAMQASLNVKKNNLNNKRLSRLQGVILKILSAAYPTGYDKRMLSRLTAEGYGRGSVITRDDKYQKQLAELARMKEKEKESPLLSGILPMLEELESTGKTVREMMRKPLLGRRDAWLNPKFSVSYSRSIRSLLSKGFVAYLPATRRDGKDGWAIFITEKGLAMAAKRKVKINAKFWEAFNKSLREKEND